MKVPNKDRIAKEIYRHFQQKFANGDIGVVESVCVTSLLLEKQKPFSLIVIAPSGQMKSSIIEDLCVMFPENIQKIRSRHTPYGLAREYGKSKLDKKTWIINDMVRTFTGISKTKIEEIVGFYSELMSEKSSGSATAVSSELSDVRMNMIGNLALISYQDVKDKFLSSTFSERIIQFTYVIDRNVVRTGTKKGLPLCNQLCNMKFEPKNIAVSKKQKKQIYELSDELTKIAHYEKYSMRPDEIVESFICAYALLNGRNKLMKSDFEVFRELLPKFKRVV